MTDDPQAGAHVTARMTDRRADETDQAYARRKCDEATKVFMDTHGLYVDASGRLFVSERAFAPHPTRRNERL